MRTRLARLTDRGRLAAIWLLAALAALAAAGVALVAFGLPSVDAPIRVEWWVLVPAFAAAETLVINIKVRREAHSLSIVEIPLTLGLAFASPVALFVGRMAGSGFALATVRRQPPVKLAFNLAVFGLETTTAIVVFRTVIGAAQPDSPHGWLALIIAGAAVQVIGMAMVSSAIVIAEPTRRMADLIGALRTSSMMSQITTLLGLVGVIGFSRSPWFGILYAIGTATVVVALRVYGTLSTRYEDLQSVHAFVNHVSATSTAGILDGVATLMRCATAELVSVGDPEGVTRVTDGVEAPPEALPKAYRSIAWPEPGAVTAIASNDVLRASFASRALEDGLIVGLGAGSGCIIVGQRVAAAPPFGADDQALLETAAEFISAQIRQRDLIDQLQIENRDKGRIIASKDELIASVSHEIRTPLTVIMGFTEVLRDADGVDAEEYRDMIREVADYATDLGTIVEDLLAVSRASTGQLVVRPSATDLLGEVGRVLELPSVRRLGEVVVTEKARVFAHADAARVRQILRNLVSNALTYGGGEVRVEIEADTDRAVIMVVDDGDGIDPGEVARLFRPFERIKRSDTEPASLGVGLSVSSHLAGLMDGDLVYDRRDDKTVFTLTLPLSASLKRPRVAQNTSTADPVESI